ncbi:MAG: hypothetical protein LQ346_008995 [Caloplaca aetnensis]|nr:MAG: hypothetical protein LQ346_008995 [Caloplaca aetnensis]
MYHSTCFALVLINIGLSFAAIPPSNAVLELPSNRDNNALNAWPPLPWEIQIPGDGELPRQPDLTMEVVWYGRDLPRERWDKVGQVFNYIVYRLGYQHSYFHPRLALARYWNPYFFLQFQGHSTTPGDLAISITSNDAQRIIRATKEHFFGYGDSPREWKALIKVDGQYRVRMTVNWEFISAAWPEGLENAVVDVHGDMALDVLTEEYGRGVDPPLMNEVREALDWFIRELEGEGPQWGLINKESYYHAFLKLNVTPPDEGPRFGKRMMRGHLVDVVTGIKGLFFEPRNWAPREFTADVLHTGWMNNLGRVNISFMGP